jgi:adenylate cyclase
VDAADFERLGVYDPAAPDAVDQLRLLAFLAQHGASEDELVAAAATGRLGGLATELAIRGGAATIGFDVLAQRASISREEATRLWMALGFADPDAVPPRLTNAEVEALQSLVGVAQELFGEQTTLGIARVVGNTASRLAEAIVDSLRVEYEAPRLAAGDDYSDVIAYFAGLVNRELDLFLAAFRAVLRRHIQVVASGRWSFDPDARTARRELVVGFVDVVGYTALSRTMLPRELSQLLDRFETIVADAVSRRSGRLVKLIGDGAMIASNDAAEACRLGLELADAFAREPELPEVRVGLAGGEVIAMFGDYFGEVVNLAARLVAVADASGVVVSEDVREAAAGAFSFDELAIGELKGFASAPRAFRVRARAAGRPGSGTSAGAAG